MVVSAPRLEDDTTGASMSLDHLNATLDIQVGQYTSAGIKARNEDAIGIRIPSGTALVTKGAAAVIADGVSASEAGKEASETAVTSFLSDYYSTHSSWSVQTSGVKILSALNRWLYGQGQQFSSAEKGYITTLSALVLKSASAYIFHVGDSRIYRLRDDNLEQLTRDHASAAGGGQRYLARALGIDTQLDVDFHRLDLNPGDQFLLTTDGVHEWLNPRELQTLMQQQGDCETLCRNIAERALSNGSDDNLSVQLIRVESPGEPEREDILDKLTKLPFPPPLSPGQIIDGWKVVRELQATHRSEVYLVENIEDGSRAVMKTPSVNFEDDPAYIERFVLEEWIGSRVQSANVVHVISPKNPRRFMYYLTEYVEGATLSQLLQERTRLSVVDTRNIITQIASGLRAFHRRDTLHQDIKPDNVIYTDSGVKIIDFGSTYIAGISEVDTDIQRQRMLGTMDYAAPEYRLHMAISPRSDQFSLAVLMYELLTGRHPFGNAYQRASTQQDFLRLKYIPSYQHNPLVPVWMDSAIQRALSIAPDKRYDALSEFIQDISHPNPRLRIPDNGPLMDRNPLLFWKLLAILLALANLLTLWLLS